MHMKLFLSPTTFIDSSKGFDISLPLENNANNPIAWYVDPPKFEPVRANGFLGSVAEGGAVNFRNIYFNPHGHGTHTECLGHITEEVYSVNGLIQNAFYEAFVISVSPEKIWNESYQEEDLIISSAQILEKLGENRVEALVLRTLPNVSEKRHKNYSACNAPYLNLDIIPLLEARGVKHLLLDLPSVDRENDGGKLAFHHAFWQVPENPQFDKTITELIYVSDSIPDGFYLLNLQTAPFVNDATPSRPVLFHVFENK